MKTRAAVLLTAGLAVAMGWAGSARAATLYWTGTGTWDQASLWGTVSGGPYSTAYGAAANDAVFEGSAGTVTVNATNPLASSMSFTVDGYTVTKNATTDVITMNGGSVNVGAGLTATIDAKISGTTASGAGFTKTGDGTLILGTGMVSAYANTWNTGTVKSTVIEGGTLKLATAFGLPGAVGASSSQRGSLIIKNGTFDVNSTSNAVALAVTLGGGAGTTANLINTGGLNAFLPVGATSITYDATGNPNMATVSANIGSGGSTAVTKTLNIGNSGATDADLEFSGEYRHAGSVAANQFSLIKTGAGTLLFSGVSQAGGTTTISAGTYIAASTSALGLGWNGNVGTAIVNDGATLGFQGGIAYTTAKPLTISGAGDAGNSRIGAIENFAGTNSFAGPITLAADSTIGATAGQLTLGGVISDGANTFNLAKDGGGTIKLTNANTYDGTTTVSAGTLLVSNTTGSGTGTGSVSVTGGILGGTGSFTGSVTVGGSGTLAPGASIESLATGALTFNDGSTFLYDLDSSVLNGDLLVANGALDINATSTLTFNELPTGALSVGSKLTLVNYSGAWNSGTFAGYANNSTFVLGTNTWQIKYDDTSGGPNFSSEQGALGFDNYLTITVVPEPSTFAMLLFGSLLWWTVGKKRRP